MFLGFYAFLLDSIYRKMGRERGNNTQQRDAAKDSTYMRSTLYRVSYWTPILTDLSLE